MEEKRLDLRDLPAGGYLVHATNCLGSWGAGVAAEIRDIFPAAYARYKEHCGSFERAPGSLHASRDLAGRCLVIPPQPEDVVRANAPDVSVVCLFTSYGYGRRTTTKPGRDPKHLIQNQTARALSHFRSQIYGEDGGGYGKMGTGGRDAETLAIFSPKFNSGLFRVPWEETAGQIRDAFDGCKGAWTVLTQ